MMLMTMMMIMLLVLHTTVHESRKPFLVIDRVVFALITNYFRISTSPDEINIFKSPIDLNIHAPQLTRMRRLILCLFVSTAGTLDTLDSEKVFEFRVICNTNTSKHIINFMQISKREKMEKI